MGDSITIVEPHADDAFLSMGGHIAQWVKDNVPVKILTVYSGTRKRASDAENYAKALGATWEGLGFIEAGGGIAGDVGELPFEPLYEPEDGELLITPIGIAHPEHKAIRQRLGAGTYYLDSPYFSQCKNSVEVEEKLKGTVVESFLRPNARKYRHIPLFKDQSKFFFYNPAESLKYNIELIVTDIV